MEVIVTGEFREWYEPLSEAEQNAVSRVVFLLEEEGVNLGHPYSSAIKGTKRFPIRELRIQHAGNAIRVLYAFDPARNSVLLIGGTKRSEGWYEVMVPKADAIYRNYLDETGQARKVIPMAKKKR